MTDRPAVAVSVVIPVYNGLPLLLEQLAALAVQDFPGAWELVIADNGSTDGTAAAVAGVDLPVPAIVVPACDRQGPSHARNVGMRRAVGEFVAFCDADDVVDPHWLTALMARAADGADLIGGTYDTTMLNVPELRDARGVGTELPDGPCGFLKFAPSGNLLVRRSAALALTGFDESLSYAEDVEFSWRAQVAGYTLVNAPDAVINYRLRSSGRALFRQVFRYAQVEPVLHRRYAAAGARRRRPAQVLRDAWWVATRSPYLTMGTRRRHVWLKEAGMFLGRVRGTLATRHLYL